MDDQILISALKQGDRNAFRSLVERYQDRVFSVCLGFVPVKEDAEDLAQDVFVEVFRSVNSFKEESALGTWIHRIAVSKSLELIRYRKREKRQAFFKSLIGLDAPGAMNVGTMLDHPGIALEDAERAKVLYEAIGRLPENQRVAFSLRQIQGMSQKDTAEIMKVSEKAVESYQSRAKANLRKSLHSFYQQTMKS